MRSRNWATAYSTPSDKGLDGDRDPQLSALQAALSRDPSVSKVWLGPEGPGRKKYMQCFFD
jgi:hypothetical protein